jgi:hypothetical protein
MYNDAGSLSIQRNDQWFITAFFAFLLLYCKLIIIHSNILLHVISFE